MIPMLSMCDEDEYVREVFACFPPEDLKGPKEDELRSIYRSLLISIAESDEDLLAPMTRYKDAHPSAWVEPTSKALPYLSGLDRMARL